MPEIPESYRYYRADPANKGALDLIIASGGLPAGFTMAEWPTYYQVRLSAERVRTDLYGFMCELWTETWGKVLADQLPALNPLRAGDEDDFDPSLDKVWTERLLGNFVELPDENWFWADVGFPDDRCARLGFHLEGSDGAYSWSNSVQLSEPWLPLPEDNRRRTNAWLLASGAASIDTQPMAAAAAEVISQLAARLR
jgi:hypothetical protein